MEIVPSQTLYINNINEKLSTEVLKRMLNMVFSQYGKVLDIIANKGLKKRGQVCHLLSFFPPLIPSSLCQSEQAWVIFQDISSATNALRGKQGFNFYGKPLVFFYFNPSTLTQTRLILDLTLYHRGFNTLRKSLILSLKRTARMFPENSAKGRVKKTRTL